MTGNTSCGRNHLVDRPWFGNEAIQQPPSWMPLEWSTGPRYPANSVSTHKSSMKSRDVLPMAAQAAMLTAPSAATAQYPPWSHNNWSQDHWPAAAPPVRSAEPYTVEHWALLTQVGGDAVALLSNQLTLWARSDNGVQPGPARTGSLVCPLRIRAKDNQVQKQFMVEKPGGFDGLQLCASVTLVTCPRRTFDPDCTPMDVPVPLNDTCRQSVLWPKTFGEGTRDELHPRNSINSSPGSESTCPALYTFMGDPDGFNQILAQERGSPQGHIHRVLTCVPRSNEGKTRPGMTSNARTAVWSQTVTTVWPPGTVAVLPAGPHAVANGDTPDYPWRINRAHVVTIVSNVPSTAVTPTVAESWPPANSSRTTQAYSTGTSSYNAMTCGQGLSGGIAGAPDARLVFLDDAACMSSRSCRPDVGAETNASSPGYRQAVDEYIASDIARLFPTGMVGCALAYDLDRETYTTDLLPVDMPLARNGAGFSFGSIVTNFFQESTYMPAVRGRWNQTSSSSQSGRNFDQDSEAEKRKIETLENYHGTMEDYHGTQSGRSVTDTSVATPFMAEGILHGPYAVYRGPVPHRMLPPSPNHTLPSIHGGAWFCGRTSPQGYFQERPYCLAICDDPRHIAVDPGLEELEDDGSVEQDGWQLIASQARQWYSYWLGYPALVLDPTVYQVDRLSQVPSLGSVRPVSGGVLGPMYRNETMDGGAIGLPAPGMRCESDDDRMWSRSWSQQARWAQRLPMSRGLLRFDVSFDAASWPAAVPLPSYDAPGLQWPEPSRQQIRWFLADLAMDLGDCSGTTDLSMWTWGVKLETLKAGKASPPRQGCSARLAVRGWCRELPMTLTVKAELQDASGGNITQSEHVRRQRGLTAGSILQRMARLMRGGPAAGLAGVHLLAVDPGSVELQVKLPCLVIVQDRGNRDCLVDRGQIIRIATRLWTNLGSILVALLAVAGSFSLQCLQSGQGRRRMLEVSLLLLLQCLYWIHARSLVYTQLFLPAVVLPLVLSATTFSRAIALWCCSSTIGEGTAIGVRPSSDEMERGAASRVGVEDQYSLRTKLPIGGLALPLQRADWGEEPQGVQGRRLQPHQGGRALPRSTQGHSAGVRLKRRRTGKESNAGGAAEDQDQHLSVVLSVSTSNEYSDGNEEVGGSTSSGDAEYWAAGDKNAEEGSDQSNQASQSSEQGAGCKTARSREPNQLDIHYSDASQAGGGILHITFDLNGSTALPTTEPRTTGLPASELSNVGSIQGPKDVSTPQKSSALPKTLLDMDVTQLLAERRGSHTPSVAMRGLWAVLGVIQWDVMEGMQALWHEYRDSRGQLKLKKKAGFGALPLLSSSSGSKGEGENRMATRTTEGGGSYGEQTDNQGTSRAGGSLASYQDPHDALEQGDDTGNGQLAADKGIKRRCDYSAACFFRILDPAAVLSVTVWAILCTLGVCPAGGCYEGSSGTLRDMPPVLLLWTRVAVGGVPAVLSLLGAVSVLLYSGIGCCLA